MQLCVEIYRYGMVHVHHWWFLQSKGVDPSLWTLSPSIRHARRPPSQMGISIPSFPPLEPFLISNPHALASVSLPSVPILYLRVLNPKLSLTPLRPSPSPNHIPCDLPHRLLLPVLRFERPLRVKVGLPLALDPLLFEVADDALVHCLEGGIHG